LPPHLAAFAFVWSRAQVISIFATTLHFDAF
jgi:hypothetical protein